MQSFILADEEARITFIFFQVAIGLRLVATSHRRAVAGWLQVSGLVGVYINDFSDYFGRRIKYWSSPMPLVPYGHRHNFTVEFYGFTECLIMYTSLKIAPNG